MKLLFENWRKYLNETHDSALSKRDIEDIITDKFSFNSLQGKEHHFTPGRPVVDYYFNEQNNEWNFVAWASSVMKDEPDFEIEQGETLDSFLTRVSAGSSQISLFENWREYLNEDADTMDEWMVWARDRATHTIGFVAATAGNKISSIDLIPDLFQTLSGESSWPAMALHIKRGIEGDLYNGLDPEAHPPVPESLMKEVLDSTYYGSWPPANEIERDRIRDVLKPLAVQIIAELEDFGKTLEKIWADPEGAQFKEKIMERAVEDWRAAKALAESIV